MYFGGCDESHKASNITVENLYWNGELVQELSDEQFSTANYTENIRYQVSEDAK